MPRLGPSAEGHRSPHEGLLVAPTQDLAASFEALRKQVTRKCGCGASGGITVHVKEHVMTDKAQEAYTMARVVGAQLESHEKVCSERYGEIKAASLSTSVRPVSYSCRAVSISEAVSFAGSRAEAASRS